MRSEPRDAALRLVLDLEFAVQSVEIERTGKMID